MAPVNCRRCDRYALVLDGHLECAVCREKRIPITGQLLENLEPENLEEHQKEYREHHARVFNTRPLLDSMEPMAVLYREDMINSPAHYNQFPVEVIDIIEWYFPNNYHLANAVKYLLRSGYKGHEIEDLKKLVWYVERYIGLKESLEDTIPDVPSVEGDS